MTILPWQILAVVLALAGGAILGEWDGAKRADQRWTAQTEKARAADLAAARTVELARYRNMEVAYAANTLQTERNRLAADRAHAAAGRLRGELATLRLVLPSLAGPAAAGAADAAYTVLGECVDRYRLMARTADAHAADAKLCVDAWPK